MEVKQVDGLQRVISGYAAIIGNIDLGNDIIEPGAFTKTLGRKQPSEIGVFIGHDTSSLPVGIPITLRVDGKGLYSETLVKPGPVGDDLLATAQFMAAHGRPLGQSIGYRVAPGGAAMDRVNGKTVRRLKEIDLHEYSFAAGMAVMNPEALTTGVKTGGGMYTVGKTSDGKWAVMRDGKAIGNPFDDEDMAKAKAATLNADTDNDGGKTISPNTLPDSAFLYVQAGGLLDDEGKTVPRALRHFRVRDAAGALDPAALADALTEIPQAKTVGLDDAERERMATGIRHLLDRFARGEKSVQDAPEWKTGLPVDLLTIAYGLQDAATRAVTEHKAMAVIGDDIRGGWKLRRDGLASLKALHAQLGRIVDHATLVAEGKDEEALADWWRAQFELIGVAQ